MTPRRVLLTGATGFVGWHAAAAFAASGLRLRALVRSPAKADTLRRHGFELVHGGLEDDEAITRAVADVDVVVHMAALTHARSDAEYHAVNVLGTKRLLDVAVGAGCRRFVYLSSLAAVGPCIGGRPVAGTDEPRPLTAYGRSKLEGERVCQAAADRIEVAILRAPAVYGPHDTDLFHFFRIASFGFMPVPTGPDRPLQMVHAADLARALVRAAMAPAARGVYHIAERQAYSWTDVGRLVGAALGRTVRPVRVPARLISLLAAVSETAAGSVGRSSIFNRDKARELLAPGWLCETESASADLQYEAGIPLADGLRATAQWYRDEGWL
jgi:nucleoside-diphosphate-sugar epimerase